MACALRDSRCPSPVGRGLHFLKLGTLRMEKLLKVRPTVPTKPKAPPHPPESCIWSFDCSSSFHPMSTVPSAGLGCMSCCIFWGLKKPICESCCWVLMMSDLLNFWPGTVLNSLRITWSLVLSFPVIHTFLIVACSPSKILISISMESPTTATSTGVTRKKR